MKKVFLSYSHKDRPFAEKLAGDLAKSGIAVWYDDWEMKPGDSLMQKVAQGIESSGGMLVLLSRNSVGSAWVEKEFSTALSDSLAQRKVKILPVLLEDCSFPRSFHFLGDIIYADFRTSYEDGLRRLLSVLGHGPGRRGVRSYGEGIGTLGVTRRPGILVALVEGLEMIWRFDSLTGVVDFLLKQGREVTRHPLISIRATKSDAYRLRHSNGGGIWGYYDLVEPVGRYISCVRLTYCIQEPDYTNLVWLLDDKRRRTLEMRWEQFTGETLFESD